MELPKSAKSASPQIRKSLLLCGSVCFFDAPLGNASGGGLAECTTIQYKADVDTQGVTDAMHVELTTVKACIKGGQRVKEGDPLRIKVWFRYSVGFAPIPDSLFTVLNVVADLPEGFVLRLPLDLRVT